jgi:ubiquinone/menaquinone biosynthesis C-methylase UbiE
MRPSTRSPNSWILAPGSLRCRRGPSLFTMKRQPAPYDSKANSYDRTWRRYIACTLGFLKDSISFRASDKILDIACGTGEFERLILSEHPDQEMIGIDISEKMLRFAREKCRAYPNAAFLKADASALPFPDHAFDLVISANSLHYFDKPNVSLIEMRRVLLPMGSLVILDWCKDYLMCRCFNFFLRRIERGYHSCYTQGELQSLLDAAGFTVQSTRKIELGSFLWGHMIAVAAPTAAHERETR